MKLNVKEKLSGIKAGVHGAAERFWQLAAVRKVTESRLVRGCQENPFPMQVLLVLCYRLALDVLYITTISPVYAYRGFTTHLDPLLYVLSWLVLAVFAPLVVRLQEQHAASSYIFFAIHYVYLIPLTSYFGCRGETPLSFLLTAIAYWALLLFWQWKLPVLSLQPVGERYTNVFFSVLTVGVSLLVLYASGRYTGFRLHLELLDVYGVRAEAAAYRLPGWLAYGLGMATYMLTIGILYCLKRKKYLAAAGLCVVFLFHYSIAAHKFNAIILLLAIGCFYVFRPWMYRWLAGIGAFGAVMAVVENKLVGTEILSGVFFRRMAFVPLSISEAKAAFFSENPLNLFREGIMGKLSFANVYSAEIDPMIGFEYMGGIGNANNGLLGDLYTNLPVLLGLLVMPLILVIIFRLIDMVSQRIDTKILFPICISFGSKFIDSSWSTVLLTHGFLLTCVLLYMFPKEEGLTK